MNFIKKFKPTPINILKVAALLLVAIFVVSALFRFVGSSFDSIARTVNSSGFATQGAPGIGKAYYGEDDYAYEEGYDGIELSARNVAAIAPEPPRPGGTTGSDAEDFEVTEYSASIESRNKTAVCAEISSLKKLDFVIFERANDYQDGCNYTFKVEHERAEEILAVIESLNPRELSENTYTIKRQLDDFTSETEILENKLDSINKTLEDAIDAYDEITALATDTQNAEALASIIDSKIGIIERLTRERINITAQLERLARSKTDQLDRLLYTYFHINVYENKIVDFENLKDSWKSALKGFVRDVNRVVQDVTINLIALLLLLAQYVIYFFIILFVAKYGWRITKDIWKKK